VEHVRVQVESVGPDDRTQLRLDADLVEDGRVAERLAHRTPHIGGEVDDSFAAVIEDQTELVAVEGLDDGYGDMRRMLGQRVDAGQLFVGMGLIPVDAESAAADRSSCVQSYRQNYRANYRIQFRS
jgi:hypothetical protein